ncbi:zinc metallopeptidase [bacterium]|nr:zinc metallopeptidase [bacterium]
MFYFWDPTLILLIPALLFAMWAQAQVKRAYNAWSRETTARRITGADAARMILSAMGIDVRIERIPGALTDHYDPKNRVLRLSEGVYDSPSVAAVGIAAHECGHAIQHQQGYLPLTVRNAIVPVVSLGSHLAIPLFLIGLIFSIHSLVQLGLYLFAGVVAFYIITLPVEFDASRRALKVLGGMNILTPGELAGAKEVLTAAALTYVAAALMALMNFLRLFLLSRRR